MKKTLITSVIVIAVVIAAIWAFKYFNPGVYMKYKCNQEGDNSRKFYGDNWQARGAVCEGLYIPFGIKLSGKNKANVLAKMGELYTNDNSTKNNMKKLAEDAANLI